MTSPWQWSSAGWRKSSRSGGAGSGSGNCVEVPVGTHVVSVRDSKAPNEGVITVSAEHWKSFVTGIRNGNHPA